MTVDYPAPNPSIIRSVVIRATEKLIKQIDREIHDEFIRALAEENRKSVERYFSER